MVVLSLFDGIDCGRLALDKLGIKVDKYYASEINEWSIKIALKNYKDIIHLGDIRNISYKDGNLMSRDNIVAKTEIDLLIGGSPCTDLSSVGTLRGLVKEGEEIYTQEKYIKHNQKDSDGESYLFWEYVRLLNQVKPKHFLLENVIMPKEWQKVFDNEMEVKPLKLNSSYVSAQNRPRLYWTNVPYIDTLLDKGVMLDDILDLNADTSDVSDCVTVEKAFKKFMKSYGYIPKRFNAYNASEITNKACALSGGSMVSSSCATLLFVKCNNGVHTVKDKILNNKYPTKLEDGRYNLRRLNFTEMERLQNLPDGYTDIKGISNQVRSKAIGNCWTVDIISYILKCLS